MKKILSIVVIGVFMAQIAMAQFFQARLLVDNIASPARLKVFIRPFAAGGNLTNVKFDRFEFFIRRSTTTPGSTPPEFGNVVTNTNDFPGLVITKGGLGAEFMNGYGDEPNKTNYYFPSSVPASATSTAKDYIAGQEYEVFYVEITSGTYNDFEFIADQVDQIPYYITLSRNTAGIGGEANLTASQAGAPADTHVFYGGTLNKVGNVFTQSVSLLPVRFNAFYAVKKEDNAKLTWVVDKDENTQKFEVERSLNGQQFEKIQTVPALANGQVTNSYEALDMGLLKHGSKDLYYRIIQVDNNGTTLPSPVRKLSVNGLGGSVTVYPNPAISNAKVIVDAPQAGTGALMMRDAIGRQVQTVNAQFKKGINQFDINVSNWAAGEYTVQVVAPGLTETVKVNKVQ